MCESVFIALRANDIARISKYVGVNQGGIMSMTGCRGKQ